MANPLVFNVYGFTELAKSLNNATKEMKSEIDREIQASAEVIVRNAQRDAPVDQAELKRSITYLKNKEMDYDIVAQVDYAAFMEWGTKKKVSVPAEYADIASQYRQKGPSFKELLAAILLWVRRKGISGTYSVKTKRRTGGKANQDAEDLSTAYAIAVSIALNGVSPHPFFFHNFEAEKPKLFARVAKVVGATVSVIQPGSFVTASSITTI